MSKIEKVLSKREFLKEWSGDVWRDGQGLIDGLGYEDLERGDSVILELAGLPDWYEIGYICSKGLELTRIALYKLMKRNSIPVGEIVLLSKTLLNKKYYETEQRFILSIWTGMLVVDVDGEVVTLNDIPKENYFVLPFLKRKKPLRLNPYEVSGPFRWVYLCPVCKEELSTGDRFCRECAQKLDWSGILK